MKLWVFLPLPYLLLHAVNLGPQPLDVPVELGDLLLGVPEVVPVPAGRGLQLFVLSRTQEQPIRAKLTPSGGTQAGESPSRSPGPAARALLCSGISEGVFLGEPVSGFVLFQTGCGDTSRETPRPFTLVWYQDSASARLRLAMSSYCAFTSEMMLSRSRFRLLSMVRTTEVSEIWVCIWDSSCKAHRGEVIPREMPFPAPS